MRLFEITIDNALCWGCRTCEVACKQENRTARGVNLIAVGEDGPRWINDQAQFAFQVNLCRHCDQPPCAEACPVEAIVKRSDGVVVMDYDMCTGCQACIQECPYDAIAYDTDRNIAQKCNVCHHRVERGLIPACADNVCPAHCISFEIQEK
ncbi:MAG: 4Fe-4S dicluster domain-containing protein [Desulfobacterales bacterium]